MRTKRHRRSRSDLLYDALRQMIVTAELAPGAALNERALCDQFGVSRTPLREAMLRLAEHGLVTIAPQHGTFVAEISGRDVQIAHFLRQNLEVPVIRALAADPGADLGPARALIVEQKLAEARQDHPGFVLLDDQFHRALFAAADLAEVWDVIHARKAHLDRVRFQQGLFRGGVSVPIAQHEAILAAIEAGDTDTAARRSSEHIAGALLHFEALQADAREPAA